ncbi:retrovirus-related pol polyprotein from transposon TNT 1-94 [Tanacetum coccineum]
MPLRKRARFTAPIDRFEVGESSSVVAARQTEYPMSREVGYKITDTWDELVDTIQEIAPTTLEGVSFMRILRLREVARITARIALEFAPDYAFIVSLLLTPLCCDDIHDVTPRVSALARRLGHANMRLFQSLASKELVRNLPKLKFDQHFYDACKIGKQAHASHKAKNTTEAFEQFEIFSRKIQNQLGCSIVSIRTNHDREFNNEVQFGEFCNTNNITHNFSAPRTPQSNGVVERKNRALQEMSKTPYELLRGRKPTLDYFKVFGSKFFILNTKDYLTKFDPKSYEDVFLGYSENSKAYIILNKHTRKIKESLNVTFDETPPPSKTLPLVDDDLDEEEAIRCLKLETELLNKKDFVEKEIYDKLFKSFTTLEKHCISLEVDTQLNQEIFQRDNSVSNQSAPSFDQLFELNELKAQSQEKDTVIKKLKERIKSLSGKMNEDKIKKDLEEIETINIELDHRVSKLIAENEHLKQTYKQLYDSIKPARIRSKEQCDDLINQVNLKSVEISDLNASLQEKVLEITALKDDLRKLKGKALVDNVVTKHTIDPKMLKIDVEPITPKLLNKRTAHSAYIKHTQEEAAVLRDLVDHVKANYPLDHSLESACRYTKLIQELLTNISKTCPSINNSGEQLVATTLKNKNKRVRFTKPVTFLGNTITKTTSTSNLVSNKPMLSSTGVKPSTQKNKVEAHPRKVESSLKNKDCVVKPK